MSLSPLPPEIRHLPILDRMHLVEEIWNSIAEDEKQFALTDAQKTELDRRLDARRANPDRGAGWEDIKKKLLGDK
jgi:putative addiction module component (TIGR02574 family)